MKNLLFIKFYKRLPRLHKQHIKKRDEILKQCQVSQATFYNWQQGITEVPTHHKPVIAAILGVEVNKLFPENENN